MWQMLKEIFAGQPVLSAEDENMAEWAKAVKDSNWLLLLQMGRNENLEPNDLFDKIALAYCYCYAASVEPTRDADWTAFKKTLENLHYPALAEAIAYRSGSRKLA
jgi:hypothetical protein